MELIRLTIKKLVDTSYPLLKSIYNRCGYVFMPNPEHARKVEKSRLFGFQAGYEQRKVDAELDKQKQNI